LKKNATTGSKPALSGPANPLHSPGGPKVKAWRAWWWS